MCVFICEKPELLLIFVDEYILKARINLKACLLCICMYLYFKGMNLFWMCVFCKHESVLRHVMSAKLQPADHSWEESECYRERESPGNYMTSQESYLLQCEKNCLFKRGIIVTVP